MASPRAILWVERLAWTLLYGGLFSVVIGVAEKTADSVLAWSLGLAGGAIATGGAVLIWVRSRMQET